MYGALHNQKFLADRITPGLQDQLDDDERERFALTYEVLHSFVVFLDPPEHTHLRRIFSRAFTPKAVQTMRGVVEDYVKDSFDGWEGRGKTVDLNRRLRLSAAGQRDRHDHRRAARGPGTLPALGRRPDDAAARRRRRRPRAWTGRRMRSSSSRPTSQGSTTSASTHPRNDMMSWLMEVQRTDPTLTADDVLHSCILLVNAGHETTQDLICNTLDDAARVARPARAAARAAGSS